MVFVLLFGCLAGMFKLYSARHHVVAQARSTAWERSIDGCPGGADRVTPEGGLRGMGAHAQNGSSYPAGSGAQSLHQQNVLNAAEDSEDLQMGTQSGKAIGVAERTVRLAPLRSAPVKVRAQRVLQCDEAPRSGNIAGALGFFWDQFGTDAERNPGDN